MKLKIAICDDDARQREFLAGIAVAWAGRMRHLAEIRQYATAKAFLFDYDEEKDFDILLLDVEMGEVNGIELAQRIRLEDSRVQIVFITGFPDFMAEGYEVAALHYLMKPVSREKLCAVLDRAAANLARPGKRLQVNFDRETCFVPFDRILYIEAQKQFVRIHTEGGDYRMKASLSEMEASLDEYFFKCQRSFLVNLNHVARIRNQCAVLKNGEEIPISRGMAEKIGKAIIKLF